VFDMRSQFNQFLASAPHAHSVPMAGSRVGDTLFVEGDYHMRGGIHKADHSLIKLEDWTYGK